MVYVTMTAFVYLHVVLLQNLELHNMPEEKNRLCPAATNILGLLRAKAWQMTRSDMHLCVLRDTLNASACFRVSPACQIILAVPCGTPLS